MTSRAAPSPSCSSPSRWPRAARASRRRPWTGTHERAHHVRGGTATPAPSASAETPSAEVTKPPATPVAAKGPPPKPGNPTFKLVKETPGAGGTTTQEYRITWTEPKGVADAFLVYGLPDCLRDQKKFDGKPCVVRGMKIPADKLVQLGVAPGDERSMKVSWDIGEIGPGPYSAILIRATNAKGDSIFTIVKSYDVCYACVY